MVCLLAETPLIIPLATFHYPIYFKIQNFSISILLFYDFLKGIENFMETVMVCWKTFDVCLECLWLCVHVCVQKRGIEKAREDSKLKDRGILHTNKNDALCLKRVSHSHKPS